MRQDEPSTNIKNELSVTVFVVGSIINVTLHTPKCHMHNDYTCRLHILVLND